MPSNPLKGNREILLLLKPMNIREFLGNQQLLNFNLQFKGVSLIV